MCRYGGIGMGQTVAEHQRKGLSSLATSHLIQEYDKLRLHPFMLVQEDNSSWQMLEKLGLEKVSEAYHYNLQGKKSESRENVISFFKNIE